jgi:hypothetical protein
VWSVAMSRFVCERLDWLLQDAEKISLLNDDTVALLDQTAVVREGERKREKEREERRRREKESEGERSVEVAICVRAAGLAAAGRREDIVA